MKLFSFFKRLKNGTVCERVWEIKSAKLAVNYKKQEQLKKRYQLYQLSNLSNIYYTEWYQNYQRLKREYASVLEEELGEVALAEPSNKIWICWFQGMEGAPEIVKACVKSVEEQFPDREIVLLTQENILQYVTLPPEVEEKVGKEISLTHYSDILRAALLTKYGGLWLDATTYCTSAKFLHEIEKLPLFAYQNVDMMRRGFHPIVAESWMIYANSNQPILLLTQKLLYTYWKREKTLCNYFLFHLFFSMACEKYAQDWAKVPVFSEVPPNIMGFELGNPFEKERWQQLLRMSDFHKLSYKWSHGDENDPNTIYNHILSGKTE